jgi:hypothetical protein
MNSPTASRLTTARQDFDPHVGLQRYFTMLDMIKYFGHELRDLKFGSV